MTTQQDRPSAGIPHIPGMDDQVTEALLKTRRFFKKREVSGDRTGLHPNTVRFHLERLEEDGLVSRRIRRGGDLGCPPLTYTAHPGSRRGARTPRVRSARPGARPACRAHEHRPGGRSHRRRPVLGPRPGRVPSRADRDTGRDRIRLQGVRRRRAHHDPAACPPHARSGRTEMSQRIGLRGHLG